MADKKISQLPAATTPLAGTEVLPIVQSSITDKVSVADLTAGRAVSAASLTLTSSPLPVASGGTNQTAFTAPSGNVKGLIYFDGTSFANDATVTDVGYDTSTNTVTTNNLSYSGALTGSTGVMNIGSGQLYKAASGNVGIGTSSPNQKLEISGASPTVNMASTNRTWWMASVETGSSDAYLQMGTGSARNNTYLTITSSGNLSIPSGNLIIGTSGKGIDFSATASGSGTMTSELLNDYEEGTWTPTYYGAAGSAGSLAYSEQTGKYTKIGRQVTVTGTIILTNKGSWTGRVQIGGFPFAPTADQYSGQIELRNCVFTGNYAVMEIGRASTTFARFVTVSGVTTNGQIEDTNVANNSGFLFTLTYMV